jgi:hypothetical protein
MELGLGLEFRVRKSVLGRDEDLEAKDRSATLIDAIGVLNPFLCIHGISFTTNDIYPYPLTTITSPKAHSKYPIRSPLVLHHLQPNLIFF